MAKFRTPNGTEIETEDPATINDYRHRTGWEEVTSKRTAKKSAAKSDENA